MTRRAEVPAEMNADHGIPFLHARADEHPVADEARVVYQHIEPAEGVDGRLHQAPGALPVGDVIAVRYGLTARRADLVDHGLRDRGIAPFTGECGAEIVDDDLRALPRKRERIGPPQPAARAGDDDHPPLTYPRHPLSLENSAQSHISNQ